jgi:hypothetical protein
MSDEELEVLITIDDPWYGPEDDIFNHLQPFTYWPDQSFPVSDRSDGAALRRPAIGDAA